MPGSCAFDTVSKHTFYHSAQTPKGHNLTLKSPSKYKNPADCISPVYNTVNFSLIQMVGKTKKKLQSEAGQVLRPIGNWWADSLCDKLTRNMHKSIYLYSDPINGRKLIL